MRCKRPQSFLNETLKDIIREGLKMNEQSTTQEILKKNY